VNALEERVRAATHAEAATMREVRPLRLPPSSCEPTGELSGPRAGAQARRPRTWIAPVTAAAAVIALAISLVAIRDIPNGGVVSPAAPAPVTGAVPRYYVTLYTPPQRPTSKPSVPCALNSPCSTPGTELLVGDTLTGAKVAIVKPPKGTSFSGVAAAADDRTFVVDAAVMDTEAQARTWYLLRIAPGTSSTASRPATTRARLTRLPIPALTGIDAIALSASGRDLAVARQGNKTAELLVYSVPSGKLLRQWSTTDQQAFGLDGYYGEQSRALAWIDGDRAIAFATSWLSNPAGSATVELTGPQTAQVKGHEEATLHMTWRRLDVAAGGGDLMADSEVIWSWTSTEAAQQDPRTSACQYGGIQLISADGRTVICGSVSLLRGTQAKPVSWRVAWLAYSLPSGAERTVYQATVGDRPTISQLWTSATGNTIIGEWSLSAPSFPLPPSHVGVIGDGTFQQLPSPPDAGGGTAPSVAW
jgi:hypothetical protein